MKKNREALSQFQTRAEKKATRQAEIEREIVNGLSESEQAVVLDFFSRKPSLEVQDEQEIKQTIAQIEDPDARAELSNLYARIVGIETEISKAKTAAVLDLAEETNIPAHALEEALPTLAEGDAAVLESSFITEQCEGNKKLDAFLQKSKQPYNLFYLDKTLDQAQLQERAELLDSLYQTFKQLSETDKDKMELILNRMFDIPTMEIDVQDYLDNLEQKSRLDTTGNYRFSEGAENKNFIYQGAELPSQVIKVSKGRHDIDFTSIIKLMRDMHYLALHFDHNQPPEKNVRINATFNDIVIYRDNNDAYKRLMRQDFAAGILIKDFPREIMENDPGFREAWKVFLRHVEKMKDNHGVVLDITDSAAGFKKERGNVANTGNIFVKLPTETGGVYEFSIIDPDVFDTADGEHKFDASEHVRKKGASGVLSALKTAATNQSRERIVRAWQDEFVKQELGK